MKNLHIRRISQIFVLLLTLYLAFSHQKYGIEKTASIDAYCPFGAIEGFLTYALTGEFLKRINLSVFVLMILVIIFTLILGRVFCSFFCPLGAIQEWLRILGKKAGIIKGFEIPLYLDKYTRYIKYFILFFIIYFSYKIGDLIFRNYDPFNALAHLGMGFEEKPWGYSILILIIIISLFTKNWWCRYFCPLGAFLGIVKKISPFKIIRDSKTCINCKACDRSCPADLPIFNQKKITSADCISCLNCKEICPNKSLAVSFLNKDISPKWFFLLTPLTFFTILLILTFTPFWKTKSVNNIIGQKGKINVDEIRGSNTLKSIIETTGIPYEVFQQELNLPIEMEKDIKLKDIGINYSIKNKVGEILETEDFRKVIKKHLK